MNRASILTSKKRQKSKMNQAVLIAEEARLAIVAALPDMQSHLRYNDTRKSRHGIPTDQDEIS